MNTKKLLSIISNIGIIISVIIGIILIGQRDGLALFKWYTVLCNIFTGIIALLFVIYSSIGIAKKVENPVWLEKFRYFSTCTVTLTIVVVATILAPSKNPGGHKTMMLESFGLYLHTICPLLSIISLLVFEQPKITFKDTLFAILPTLSYAVVLIILNVADVLTGPYFFLQVKKQGPLMTVVWTIVLSTAAYIFNIGIFFILKLINKKK